METMGKMASEPRKSWWNLGIELPKVTMSWDIYILLGGFKHVLFSIIYGIILPIDYQNGD